MAEENPHWTSGPRYVPRSFLARPEDFGKVLTPEFVPATAQDSTRLAGAKTQNILTWRIRHELHLQDMTILQLARATGLNYQRLTRVLRGTLILRMEDLGLITKVIPGAFPLLSIESVPKGLQSSPGSREGPSAHIGGVETLTPSPKPMFPHDVPAAEPPIGTVAVFRSSFAEGGGGSTGMMLRTEYGWSTDIDGLAAVTWAELTDLETMNAAVLARNPRSTARYVTVQVIIVAAPLQGAGA